MKVNFEKVEIQLQIEGSKTVLDCRKSIGNLVWSASTDIETSDFGKTIYYSEGEIDVPEDIAKSILGVINNSSYYAPVKRQFAELLTSKQINK